MLQTTETNQKGSAMLTDSFVDHIVAIAGPDFTYPGVKGCDRPSSAARRGLRAYLHAAQGGLCVHCGFEVALEDAHTAHVVSRGGAERPRGFLPTGGNLMVTHSHCNVIQRDEIGPVVYPRHLARPDLVVMEYPVRAMAGFAAYDPR